MTLGGNFLYVRHIDGLLKTLNSYNSSLLQKLNCVILLVICWGNDNSSTNLGDEFSLLRYRPEELPHSLTILTLKLTQECQYGPKSYQGSQYEQQILRVLTQSKSKLRHQVVQKVNIEDNTRIKVLVGKTHRWTFNQFYSVVWLSKYLFL